MALAKVADRPAKGKVTIKQKGGVKQVITSDGVIHSTNHEAMQHIADQDV